MRKRSCFLGQIWSKMAVFRTFFCFLQCGLMTSPLHNSIYAQFLTKASRTLTVLSSTTFLATYSHILLSPSCHHHHLPPPVWSRHSFPHSLSVGCRRRLWDAHTGNAALRLFAACCHSATHFTAWIHDLSPTLWLLPYQSAQLSCFWSMKVGLPDCRFFFHPCLVCSHAVPPRVWNHDCFFLPPAV